MSGQLRSPENGCQTNEIIQLRQSYTPSFLESAIYLQDIRPARALSKREILMRKLGYNRRVDDTRKTRKCVSFEAFYPLHKIEILFIVLSQLTTADRSH